MELTKGVGWRAWVWPAGGAFWDTEGEVGAEWEDGVLVPRRGPGTGEVGIPVLGRAMKPNLVRFSHLREDSSGAVIKEDYPMNKEELLSQVMKSMELQDLEETPRKVDSSPSLIFSNPEISLSPSALGISKPTSTVPESILSHKGRGRGTGSTSHVTFGDSASAAGPAASASVSGALASSRSSSGVRGGFRHTSSSGYLGSTGYMETSQGHESTAGRVQTHSMGSELSRGLTSSSIRASSPPPASRPSSSTSKDSRSYS